MSPGRTVDLWWAWVDLNHRPRPYQGLLWCYMHSGVAMIILLTTSLMVTSWHDCWFQVACFRLHGNPARFRLFQMSRSCTEIISIKNRTGLRSDPYKVPSVGAAR